MVDWFVGLLVCWLVNWLIIILLTDWRILSRFGGHRVEQYREKNNSKNSQTETTPKQNHSYVCQRQIHRVLGNILRSTPEAQHTQREGRKADGDFVEWGGGGNYTLHVATLTTCRSPPRRLHLGRHQQYDGKERVTRQRGQEIAIQVSESDGEGTNRHGNQQY